MVTLQLSPALYRAHSNVLGYGHLLLHQLELPALPAGNLVSALQGHLVQHLLWEIRLTVSASSGGVHPELSVVPR